MSVLADKIRKMREVKVPFDDFSIIVRRPSDLEMIELRGKKMAREVIQFVSGWKDVTEIVILGNGSPHPLDYDAEACAVWLEDKLDITSKLIEVLLDSYSEHRAKLDAEVKN